MTATTDQQPGADVGGVGREVDLASLTWTDVDGQTWRVELSADRLLLQRESDDTVRIDLPADRWKRDIYVAEHGSRFIVRVDTFDCTVRFMLEAETAEPLLRRLAPSESTEPTASTEPVKSAKSAKSIKPGHEEPVRRAGPLLWPKVSPLAVWALICSALVFVPGLGLMPAAATVVLLTFHRLKVRRTAAMGHSRFICTMATVSCLCGLGVSTLAMYCANLSVVEAVVREVGLGPVPGGKNWGVIAAGVLVVFLSLSFHEAAHAITALWLGDDLARSQGRVTLNPMSHVDPFGTVLLPIVLAVSGMPIFGYARPVPVRVESLPNRRRAHILIALAGPGSNLLLAAASLMMLLGMVCAVRIAAPDASVTHLDLRSGMFAAVEASGFALAPAFGPVCTVLKLSFIINTFLAMFNLIPIPPLDGSWVLEHMFPGMLGNLYARIRPYGFIIFIAAIYMGLFKYLVIPVFAILLPGLGLVSAVTGF
ncbi:MAG: site-2 protease family protein [Planctomycetes bacterium]|nr:site-2 protease family protein [Planctomycetota bacterium]